MRLPHNFAKRYLARMIGAVVAAALILLSLFNPELINDLRLKSYDLLLRARPASVSKKPVLIVDIDDHSLEELGQWPWPRSLWAGIIEKIGAGQPRAIGFDIVFAEPDRSSPRQVAQTLESCDISDSCRYQIMQLPDHDVGLGKALFMTPTVLGFPFIFSQNQSLNPPANPSANRFIVSGDGKLDDWLMPVKAAAFNLPVLQNSAIGNGFFNVLPDADGIIRRVPLAMALEARIYPSLALEMLRIGENIPINRLHLTTNGIEGISCGPYQIPTDAYAQINVNYRGKEGSFAYLSAADVIKGRISSDTFTGAYVLIGTSASGLVDIVTSPTSACFPGVEVHANILNTILTGSWIREPDWARGAEFCYLLIISLLLIILVPAIGAIGGGIVLIFGTCGIIALSWWTFSRQGYFFDAVYPLFSGAFLFSQLSFMNYFLEERSRRQTRRTFSKYVAPEVVEELLKDPQKVNLKGEERVLTAFFSDIRGFTKISESLTPEEVCASLNQYLTMMTRIIRGNRGTVDKFIGDAVFAFWNAPLADPEHARRALSAAILMRAGIKDLNDHWKMHKLPTFETGIGIHSGPAQVGNIGSEDRLSYTAIGDNINLTSRLEGVTKYYGVPTLVSGATRKLVDTDEFAFCKVDRIQVVGRHEPVEIFALIDYCELVSGREMEAIKVFESALELYFTGYFVEARSYFEKLNDFIFVKLQNLFCRRCRLYAESPPPEGWDGVFVMESK